MTCGDSLLNLLNLCFMLIFILIQSKLSVNRNLVTLVVRGCQKLLEDRVLFITGEINDRLANFIVPAMLYLANESSRKPIKLYINSPGGSITAGMAIYDTMRTISCPVHTVGMGMCASMASFLLSMGDKRSVLENTEVMIHQPLTGVQGQQTDIQIVAKHIERLREKLERKYAEKSNGKITYEQIHEACERDNYLEAQQALDMGLIDEIINAKEKK